ncbi:hypothetical protein [Amycolatopsis thermoflava]|uniref:hypothetical protein n=1 Tax=Amycolatopsis thermoflava TaxID=84480 RepID=UPI000489FE88|nr:hypothetical protein [Amycolatopsis thermoflava]
MEIREAIQKLFDPGAVTFHSTPSLAGKVTKHAAKLDKERVEQQKPRQVRKPALIPVPADEHRGSMTIAPWELLHTLGRATVLAGQGSSRALSQHWSCLKYITTLHKNYQGRLELTDDGRDPRYHRKSVQAEDLGIAFALAAALRIVTRRHPGFHFEIVDADVALEAGWALRGAEVRARESTRLRPDYFLVGSKLGEPVRLVTVECKGSHGKPEAQHGQLAKAAAQVHAVVIGSDGGEPAPPPSLLMATALAGAGGIEMRILDPEGDGELVVPGDRAPRLNGPVEQLNQMAAIPVASDDDTIETRPGFFIPPSRTEWFSRVLKRTAAASLLTFAGDRGAARSLLTRRQQQRLGSEFERPGTSDDFDTEITLGDLRLVGTDQVFRFDKQRVEVFSGTTFGLYRLLREQDLSGYEQALPEMVGMWRERERQARDEWKGVIFMDEDGAVMGLRVMSDRNRPLS